MQASRLRMFSKLYKKEMRELIPEITGVIVVAIILNLIMAGTAEFNDYYSSLVVISIPLLMVFGLAAFLPLISSFKLFSKEWSNNTVYLMMSLPVKGDMIIGAKFLALLSQFLIGTLIALITSSIFALFLLPASPDMEPLKQLMQENVLWKQPLFLYLGAFMGTAYIIAISFFSQMIGRLVSRFSGLLTAAIFILSYYISNNFIIEKAHDYLWVEVENSIVEAGKTDIIELISIIGENSNFLGLSSLVFLLVALAFFILAVVVYNRKIEL